MEEAEEYNKIHLRLKLVAQILFHLFRQQHCKREISIRNATVNVCLKYQYTYADMYFFPSPYACI